MTLDSGACSLRLRLAILCIGASTLAAPVLAWPQTFVATGQLATARALHTATQLPSGKVLIVGGTGNFSRDVTTAELYNPACGVFTATGSPAQSRYRHTATLLTDGTVLIAAGYTVYTSPYALTSAEVYDPSTGVFSTTGSLRIARYQHTATLLPSGKVLIAGGVVPAENPYGAAYTTSAEIYDPATRTFSMTGSMRVPRQFHTATLLANGKVLIAGGVTGASLGERVAVASAELYDPATGSFSDLSDMTTPRARHTATALPNGKVLLVAGNAFDGYNGLHLASTELFDPTTGAFTASASLAYARDGHSAAATADGRVLIAGGKDPYNSSIRSAELYDTATATVRAAGTMVEGSDELTATLLSTTGRILLTGGFYWADNVTARAELYSSPLVCQ